MIFSVRRAQFHECIPSMIVVFYPAGLQIVETLIRWHKLTHERNEFVVHVATVDEITCRHLVEYGPEVLMRECDGLVDRR